MGHVSPHRTGQGLQAVSPKATSGVPVALPEETSPTLLWAVGCGLGQTATVPAGPARIRGGALR